MLKNAIFNDLFLTNESKNINNIKTANKKLHDSEMRQLKIFAKRVNNSHIVKQAGKKCTNFKPFGKNL